MTSGAGRPSAMPYATTVSTTDSSRRSASSQTPTRLPNCSQAAGHVGTYSKSRNTRRASTHPDDGDPRDDPERRHGSRDRARRHHPVAIDVPLGGCTGRVGSERAGSASSRGARSRPERPVSRVRRGVAALRGRQPSALGVRPMRYLVEFSGPCPSTNSASSSMRRT